jgi:hypothetical protein
MICSILVFLFSHFASSQGLECLVSAVASLRQPSSSDGEVVTLTREDSAENLAVVDRIKVAWVYFYEQKRKDVLIIVSIRLR